MARTWEALGDGLTPEQAVARILARVRTEGDAALRDLARRLDGVDLGPLEVSPEEVAAARAAADPGLVRDLETAAQRIRAFHERQRRESWVDVGEGALGQIVRPLDRVGVYAPGGRAAYPSTVLMTAIPARVAGVREVVLCTPAREGGRVNPVILAAAAVAGVDRVFRLGGAQAIAALAYGTESVPGVDKVCGPGNLFVALAKRQVYGTVGIDALQGPTEALIIADESADPTSCALDLLAQAEHDELAAGLLITTARELAEAVEREVERLLPTLERRDIIRVSLEAHGALVLVDRIEEAIALSNL
ncbi:MAG: histidinol dehydrogenase, partial [Chloroflexi bacterium]|nr:histidinol dehydrogenase [Chloroflexota bacterium]